MAKKPVDPQRAALREIAESTVRALDRGAYVPTDAGAEVDLTEAITRTVENTRLYLPDGPLVNWFSPPSTSSLRGGGGGEGGGEGGGGKECRIIILNVSTLAATRLLATTTARAPAPGTAAAPRVHYAPDDDAPRIGVLNFASAKTPGGGFLAGAQAQEESLARSSTLYPSLLSPAAEQLYTLNRHDPRAGYYAHALVYSPGVVFFRDDDGTWLRPVCADVLSAPAVDARVVRQSLLGRLAPRAEAAKIAKTMRERAARALYAFERHGVRSVVLGAWGAGVFGNEVRVVACIWADLLGINGRFRRSFDRVVFAVLGSAFAEFEAAFEARAQGDGRYTGEGSSVSVDSIGV